MDQQPPPDHLSDSPFPPPPDAGAQASPPRARGRIAVAAIVAFALLIGGGAAAAFMKMRGSGEVLFSKVPASSDVVFTVYLDPSAGQKANLFMLASKFPALGSEPQLVSRFQDVLDQGIASTGLGHDDLSWVGDQMAFVADAPSSLSAGSAPSFALLIDTNDGDAAKATLQTLQSSGDVSAGGPVTNATIDGVAVTSDHDGAYAVFDGTVVVASSLDEMSAIVSTAHGHQPALEGSSGLQAATAGLPEGKLALLYVNPTDLVKLAQQVPGFAQASGASGSSTFQAMTGLAVTVSAEPDGLAFDAQAILDPSKLTAEQRAGLSEPDHPNPLLTSVPADALAVISGAHLDTTLSSTADRMAATSPRAAQMLRRLGIAELVSAIDGDVAVEAGPDGGGVQPGATLILGARDDTAMQHALDQLATGLSSLSERQASSSGGLMVAASSSSWATHDYKGVTIHVFQMAGVPDISYAVFDDTGVIGTSAAQVEHVIDTAHGGPSITGSAAYKDAMAGVPSSDGSVWVDIQGIVQMVRQSMPPQQRTNFDRITLPNLAPLKALVIGSESDTNHERVRIFLRIG
jgi:Protein of unknown function (DUF3352)